MIIMKFGGSSVKDAGRMRNVAEIIIKNIDKQPLVVLSALGGITDQLIDALTYAARQRPKKAKKEIDRIEQRHKKLISELFTESKYIDPLYQLIFQEIEKLRVLLGATETIRVESKRIANAVMSAGEILSSNILTQLLKSMGIASYCLDARKMIYVEFHDQDVVPLLGEIKKRAGKKIQKYLKDQQILVTQGFIASTRDGAPATLGRDGSDYTASLLGAALACEEIQIWSDVDGILTADPTIVPEARPLKTMTFDEACELAYFGARVLQPATIQPALESGILVRVLNSNHPDEKGTVIISGSDTDKDVVVKSIAYKENITLLTIESSRLLLSPKIMEEIFMILYRRGKRVYAVSKSATKVSITIETNSDQKSLVKELAKQGQVHVDQNKVIVSVVGEKMRKSHELNYKILQILDEESIHIDLISQFANQISLTFIVDEKDIERAVKLLHDKLIS
ncbi:MAG: aspartate kinase [Calditrichaceae bacterium]|nr:aspartate kinase [Calditrichaceae bacterium]RQV92731.1 MAG: aspartate kinase [Calditrichota bacterium]